ncbi:MAG: type II toxin-antitoxin system RelE/ParE family toxin [Acidobacteria bacterium]|nr:type II toxin-antitoxin system RelE/ParE family toxin [Acidobacteriota bacterium]
MDLYSVVLKPTVEKDLRRLPGPITLRVMERIQGLASEPFPPGSIKLSGTEKLCRLRVGDYRIIYEVDRAARVVTVD